MLQKLLFAGLLMQALPASAQDLALICEGNMRGMFTEKSTGGTIFDNKGNSVSGGASSARYGDISTTAQFRLAGAQAQLNLPQPPTCSICIGEKGWREVKGLKVEPDKISGKIRYGLLSGATFEIDRRTGIMTSSNGYRGTCEAQDLSNHKF